MKYFIYTLETAHGFKTFCYDPLTMFAMSAKDFFFKSNELKHW